MINLTNNDIHVKFNSIDKKIDDLGGKIIKLDSRVLVLDKRINKMPTWAGVATILVIGVPLVFSLFFLSLNHLLNYHDDKVSAETKTIITEAINTYADKDKLKYAKLEKSIVNKVLVKLGLK